MGEATCQCIPVYLIVLFRWDLNGGVDLDKHYRCVQELWEASTRSPKPKRLRQKDPCITRDAKTQRPPCIIQDRAQANQLQKSM